MFASKRKSNLILVDIVLVISAVTGKEAMIRLNNTKRNKNIIEFS